jgi:aspartate/methionine/tyrosine aminotransferase
MRPKPGYDFCEVLPIFLGPVENESARADTYNFGIGDIRGVPGYEEILTEALGKALTKVAQYLVRLPGQQGFAPLCNRLAQVHSKISSRAFSSDDVLLTEGGCSAISIALTSVLEPGAKVAYAVPAFPYWCMLDAAGLQSVPIPFYDPHEYAATYGDRLRKTLETDTDVKALILNEPQNPMGFPLQQSQLEIIGALAAEHDLKVVVDDVAATFAFRTEQWSARHISPDRCFIVGSFTKQFATPGLRLGWLIPPRPQLAAARSIVSNLRGGVSNVAAFLGWTLLEYLALHGHESIIEEEVRRRVHETASLNEVQSSDVRFWIPGQGLYLLGQTQGAGLSSSTELVSSVRHEGVRLIDHTFLFPPECRTGNATRLFRLSIGGEWRVRQGIGVLQRALRGRR